MNSRLIDLRHVLATCTAAIVAAAAAFTAKAEALPADFTADSIITLGELSVTAIKYGDGFKNKAIASTTIGKREIERYRVYSFKDVSAMVPNFYIPDYGSRMTSSIYMRGQGTRIDQPVVGMNIDNVPILTKENYDLDLLDIERIEVLRGPQSALFGRNTMAGVINVTTLSPFNFQGSRAMLAYSSGNSFRVGLSTYHLLAGERLGLSVAGGYSSSDGFFTNEYTGRKLDHEKIGEGRAKLQWKASEDLRIDNVLSFSVSRQGGYPYESAKLGKISYNDTCFYRRTGISDGLTMELTRDKYKMTSITSYQYLDDNMTLDQDFLPVPYFTLTQKRREHALTHDLTFRSPDGNGKPYSWLTGFFGFYKRTLMDAPVTFKEVGIDSLILKHRNQENPDYPIRWESPQFVLNSNFKTHNFGLALYHQSTYKLDRWTFTAALRLDFEFNRLNYVSWCNTGYDIIRATDGSVYRHDDVNINDPGSRTKTFLQLLPKVAASYSFDTPQPISVFASVAKGYKAGGFNTQMFSDVLQQRLMNYMGFGSSYKVEEIIAYKPETNWTIEAGAHAECFGGRIRTDLSVFYIHTTDQQLTMFPDGNTTGRIMTNAGRSRSYGAEASIRATPIDPLTVSVSYGFTDARFIEFDNGRENYSGKYIPYAPKNTIFAAVNYVVLVNRTWLGSIAIDAHARAVGEIYWNETNDEKQPMYCLPGASVTLSGQHYSLELWGENLADTDYRTFYFVSIGNAFFQRGKPLTVGATLRLNI